MQKDMNLVGAVENPSLCVNLAVFSCWTHLR